MKYYAFCLVCKGRGRERVTRFVGHNSFLLENAKNHGRLQGACTVWCACFFSILALLIKQFSVHVHTTISRNATNTRKAVVKNIGASDFCVAETDSFENEKFILTRLFSARTRLHAEAINRFNAFINRQFNIGALQAFVQEIILTKTHVDAL